MPARFSISLATVVMLVLLRLTIGWHFFSEGMKHYNDPRWTSEPTLRSAKGPLAPMYQSYLPDFHGFDEILHGPQTQTDKHAADAWSERIEADWADYHKAFALHHELNERQQKQAAQVLQQYQAKVRDWAKDNREAVATHIHQWERKETTRSAPAGDLPFQKKRLSDRQGQLAAEANGWQAELKSMELGYQTALGGLLDAEQRNAAPMPAPATSIGRIDRVMTYGILAVGLLLLLGLLTRLACVAGAAFLLSVVLMQPFWVADTAPTYNQYVEMAALLALATTSVGQWGGLDFFLSKSMTGSRSRVAHNSSTGKQTLAGRDETQLAKHSSTKGMSDVSQS